MKRRLVAFVGGFCIAMLVVTAVNAKKPANPSESEAECITFTGNLVGDQQVEGCCPNAGPWPAYEMELKFSVGTHPPETYVGHVFMNYFGAGRNRKYIVQFWTEDFGIEVIGGVIENDRKSKKLTVTFTDEDCLDLDTGAFITRVSFVLVRTSDLDGCPVVD